MAEITAASVRELREKTGAGMMDCKKALTETNGDMEAAIDWLRTKGLAAAAKKAGRVAAEGLVGVATSGHKGAIVEINAETDFVGRNEHFQNYVKEAAKLALKHDGTFESFLESPYGNGRSIKEELTHLISVIGENMEFRRLATASVTKGAVISYIHSAISPGLGRIGVMVALESEAAHEKLEVLGKQLSMHIAATSPQSICVEELSSDVVKRERDIFAEQARASGKPEAVIEKMIEGRLRKFYEEAVLLEQVFVIDGESRVKDILKKFESETGSSVKLKSFVRYGLGEGIEKKSDSFADEVASLVS
jgi:elongation factor Ts